MKDTGSVSDRRERERDEGGRGGGERETTIYYII